MRVHFSGGRVEHADILVGGDGVRSGVRAQIMPDVQPIYAGYYIWRGAPNEADLSPRALKEVFPYFSFFLPPQQEVICYPIAGFNDDLRPGHRRFNFIWYRVADAHLLKEMCVDDKRPPARLFSAAAADPQGPDRGTCGTKARMRCRPPSMIVCA